MYITILLLGVLLFGLILIGAGVAILLKVKNKLAGILAIAAGLILSLASSAIFLALAITTSVQG
jgi:hypothetical protein